MTKPDTASAEAGFKSAVAPMQESLERFRDASERWYAFYRDIAAKQANFLQRTVFDGLAEFRDLSHVKEPAELLELSTEFAVQQADRSMKAFADFSNEVCGSYFEALKATTPKAAKSHPLH